MAVKPKPKKKGDARAKLKKFQQKIGLPVTGKYDSTTRQELKRAKRNVPSQTPKAKAARRKERANDPAQLTQPLTPALLDKEIQAQTRIKYGGAEKALQDETRVSDAMHPRIDSWWGDYQAQIQRARQEQQQANLAAQGQVEQNVQRDTASSDSPEARQALLARQQQGRSYGSLIAGQGANQQVGLSEQDRITGLRKVQAHTDEDSRRRAIVAKLGALKGEEGDFGVSLRRDARASERNLLLQREALGLKAEDSAADRRIATKNANTNRLAAKSLDENREQGRKQKARDRAEKVRHNRAEEKFKRTKFRSEQEKDAYARAHKVGAYKLPAAKGGKGGSGGSGGGKKPKALTRGDVEDRRKISAAKAQYEGQYKSNYRRYFNDGRAHNVDPAVLHAGYELSKQGFIGPNTARNLKRLGYRLPAGWTKRRSTTSQAKQLFR